MGRSPRERWVREGAIGRALEVREGAIGRALEGSRPPSSACLLGALPDEPLAELDGGDGAESSVGEDGIEELGVDRVKNS